MVTHKTSLFFLYNNIMYYNKFDQKNEIFSFSTIYHSNNLNTVLQERKEVYEPQENQNKSFEMLILQSRWQVHLA